MLDKDPSNRPMSTQIRFRLSGEEEEAFLVAARRAGLSPDAYARVRALAPVDPLAQLPKALEERLAALEAKLIQPSSGTATAGIPATLVKGLEVTDLILELRREQRAGINAFLRLLDGEPLPDIPHRRATPDQSDFLTG